MAIGTWVKRSLRYYGARHLVFAGTVALTSAILCAALLTGESLQQGLQRDLHARLGAVRSAVFLQEGVFPANLAQRVPDTQAALLLRGELLTADGSMCANDAQIIGVFATNAVSETLTAELNTRAREILPAEEGAVRFAKPALFSAELPLGSSKDTRMVRRAVRLASVPEGRVRPLVRLLTPDFALRPSSVLPLNAMLPYAALAEAAGVPGRANLLVSAQSSEDFERALAQALTPEDVGLVLEGGGQVAERRASSVECPETVIKSRRIFLPKGIVTALTSGGFKIEPATFHLADAFEAGTQTTPYGFVAAVTPDGTTVPRDLKDDEVIINAWLAETLSVKADDTLTLRWRRFEAGGRLVADSRTFRVRAVIRTEQAASAKETMPVFPGLSGVDSCTAWDVGMPMDDAKLKDAANEAYWKQWRETPKAFVTYAAGTACFGTFFGEAMCVRVAADEPTVRRALKTLSPVQAGFTVRPVWREGLKAAQGSTDFRLLFVGMAFVLVTAALLLSSLSLSLALETRKSEVALFGALGWRRGRVLQALTAEWSVPLAGGALAGGALGVVLARTLVWSLAHFWCDAFAGANMTFHFSWPMAGLAAGVSLLLTLAVLLRTAQKFAFCKPVELWQGEGREYSEDQAPERSKAGDVRANVAGGTLAVAALGVMIWSPSGAAANGAFFGAGFLLMLSLLLFLKTLGKAWNNSPIQNPLLAGVRRAMQTPRRSAPVVLLLSLGIFLTVGILSMKNDPAADCERPSSGSGGFASLVTSVTAMDRERGLELARKASGGKGVVPIRIHEGDEAGCLNMNQPQTPRLYGLDARAMARARAFEPENSGGVWTVIEQPLEDGTIPALAADQTMLEYSLKAKVGPKDGTVWNYAGTDGTVWKVRIVGALPVRSGILQGALLVDERLFARMFPNEGYRLWLCDAAPAMKRTSEVSDQKLAASLPSSAPQARHPEAGVTVQTAEARLRLLGSVESAYLDMFLVLGGLGVVLGVLGIALVILRGVTERRGELALLSALGLTRRTVVILLVAEYGVLVLAGLVVGSMSALVAIQPAVRSLGSQLPWGTMAGLIAGLFVSAAMSVFCAALAASRRYGPEVLKEEV